MALVKSKHLALYKKYTEQLIEDLSSSVILVMPGDITQCPNCIYDTVHKASSGKYNGSGPTSFTGGICPVCNGEGQIDEKRELTIQCTVNWINPTKADDFKSTTVGNIEENFCKIKSLVSNHEDIKNADYLIVDDVRTRLVSIVKRGLKENVTTIAIVKQED